MKISSGHSGPLPDNARTIDHLVDRARGGSNELDNLVLACSACNLRRSRASASPFLTETQLVALIRGR